MLTLEKVSLDMAVEENKVTILHDIDITFKAGKMYALTGPNGSGKSSIARVAMGIYRPTRGKVYLDGEDITNLNITERARRGIGYAFQQPARFKGLQVKDLLNIAAGDTSGRKCSVLHHIGLCPDEYKERSLDDSLSGGEMKRIEIATLLAQNPRVRIFDEPEAGIDLWSFEQLIEVIGSSHNEKKVTVIISHQEKILNMVDEIVLVEEGRISMRGGHDDIWPLIKESAECACRKSCLWEDENYADCPR